jgi:hypothetical protein
MADYFWILNQAPETLHTDWKCRSNFVVFLCRSLSINNITTPVFVDKVHRILWNTRENYKPGSYVTSLSQYSDGLRAGRPGFDSRQDQEIFLFSTAIRLALGPTQSPIQWVPGAISLGINRPGVKLTTHLHLVPRSKIVELYLQSFPNTSLCLNWLSAWTILPLPYSILNIIRATKWGKMR